MITGGLGSSAVGRFDGMSKTLGMYNLLNKPWGPRRARFRVACSADQCTTAACALVFRPPPGDPTAPADPTICDYCCERHLPTGRAGVQWEPVDRRVYRVRCAEPLEREWTVQCWPDAEVWQCSPNAAGASSRVLLLFRPQEDFCFEADVTGAGGHGTLVFQQIRQQQPGRRAYASVVVDGYSGDMPISERQGRDAPLTAEDLVRAVPAGGAAYLCDWAGVVAPRDMQVYRRDGRLAASYALGANAPSSTPHNARAPRPAAAPDEDRPEPGAPRVRRLVARLPGPRSLLKGLALCAAVAILIWVGCCGWLALSDWYAYRRALGGASDALLRYIADRPDGRYVQAAGLVADDRAWEELRGRPSEQACSAYLEHFPDGGHSDRVATVADSLAWHQALAADTELAYAEYASQPYASLGRREVALDRAARLAYTSAERRGALDTDERVRIARAYRGTDFGERAAKTAFLELAERARKLEEDCSYAQAAEVWRRAGGILAHPDALAGVGRCTQRAAHPVEVAKENVKVARWHSPTGTDTHVTRSFLVGFELSNHSREPRQVIVEVLLAAYARAGSGGREVARHEIALTLGPRETRWVSRTYDMPALEIDLKHLSKRVRVIDEEPSRPA